MFSSLKQIKISYETTCIQWDSRKYSITYYAKLLTYWIMLKL